MPLIEQLERFYEGLGKTVDQPMQDSLRRYDDLLDEQSKGVQSVAARLSPKAALKRVVSRWHDEKLRLAALECAIELEAGSSALELGAVIDGSPARFELKREENGYLLVARIENDPTVSSFSFGGLALPAPTTPKQLQYSDEDGEMLIRAAMLKARAENKFILVSFGGNWCHPCLELTTTLLNDPKVAPVVRDHFVIVKVNIGNHDKNAETCHRFQLDLPNLAVPRVLILDTNANVLAGGAGQQPLFEDTGDSDKLLTKLRQLIATIRGRTEASGEPR